MSNWRQKLQEMVNTYNNQITSIENQITSLDNKITDLQEQANAINVIAKKITENFTQRLIAKRDIFQSDVSGGKVSIKFGKNYGTNNLVDWYIYWSGDKAAAVPIFGKVLYKYKGAGWDNDSLLMCLLEEFGFVFDYVNVDINVGLYGLNSNIELLNTAKEKLREMAEKFRIAKNRFESFLNTGVSRCLIKSIFP